MVEFLVLGIGGCDWRRRGGSAVREDEVVMLAREGEATHRADRSEDTVVPVVALEPWVSNENCVGWERTDVSMLASGSQRSRATLAEMECEAVACQWLQWHQPLGTMP